MKKHSRILLICFFLFSIFSLASCVGPSNNNIREDSSSLVLSQESAIKKITNNKWQGIYYNYNGQEEPSKQLHIIQFKIDREKKIITVDSNTASTAYQFEYSDISWNLKKKQLFFSHEDYPGIGYRFTFQDDNKIKFKELSVAGYTLLTKIYE